MPDRTPITIPLDFPSSDEVWAFAQLLKRLDYATCVRFASKNVWYSGRAEADVMWSAVRDIQRQFSEAGFAPR